MKRSNLVLQTDKEIKIAFDPFRLTIIELYFVEEVPLTAMMVAKILEEDPARVNYHIKKLVSIDVLTLDHTKDVNGITAKYYALKYRNIKVAPSLRDTPFYRRYRETLHNTNFRIYTGMFIKDMEVADELLQDKERYDRQDVVSHYKTLYMTKEERKEVNDLLIKIMKMYGDKDESKKTYGFLAGFAITNRSPKV